MPTSSFSDVHCTHTRISRSTHTSAWLGCLGERLSHATWPTERQPVVTPAWTIAILPTRSLSLHLDRLAQRQIITWANVTRAPHQIWSSSGNAKVQGGAITAPAHSSGQHLGACTASPRRCGSMHGKPCLLRLPGTMRTHTPRLMLGSRGAASPPRAREGAAANVQHDSARGSSADAAGVKRACGTCHTAAKSDDTAEGL